MKSVIVDAGPLVAFLDRSEIHHQWVTKQLTNIKPPLVTCEAVIAETLFLLRHRHDMQVAILELLSKKSLVIGMSLGIQVEEIRDLFCRYKNVPMSLADACLVRLSEILDGYPVFTLDLDFVTYRKNKKRDIPILHPDYD